MNILIKLTCLIGLVIAPILGEGTVIHSELPSEEMLSPQPSENEVMKLTQSSLMTTKATSFTFDRKNKAVSSFTFNTIECNDEGLIYKELIQLSEKEEMYFKSESDVTDYVGDLEFDKTIKGVLVIGGNKFKSEFLFNANKENKGISFTGMLNFSGGDILKNTSDMISIFVKGKQ